ncbi:MAG: nitroreductase [Proteobacteria bacterium]|nr:nitroreductase [Pseudomonadota bacterium]MDA1331941.1 nitroreductase [Pseudomonadota bacterium]
MSVLNALEGRYSCRKFLSTTLSRTVINSLLETTQKTASWCNTQPWSIDVVSGESLRRLSDSLIEFASEGNLPNPDLAFPEQYLGLYRERRKVSGLQLYKSIGIEKGDIEKTRVQALENFYFFGAPHALLISTPKELGLYGALDCGLYISSFMLLAQELGINTIAQASVANYPDVIRQHVQIDVSRNFLCGISFGYGEETHPVNAYRTERESIENVVVFYD